MLYVRASNYNMTAEELFTFLQDKYSINTFALCSLHKPCATKARCERRQATQLLNFDDVKGQYCSKNNCPSLSSVDGYGYKGSLYCFIEIKGWLDFMKWTPKEEINELTISYQADRYDFKKKIIDSVAICRKATW